VNIYSKNRSLNDRDKSSLLDVDTPTVEFVNPWGFVRELQGVSK